MVKTRAKGVHRRKRHTARNLSILAIVSVIVVIAVALSGALTPAAYIMIVHIYDNHNHPQTVYDLTEAMLITNVNVTVSGVDQPTRFTPTGIIGYDQLSAGTYHITVSGNASITVPFAYEVGANCADRTPDGQCHALVPATITYSQ